MQPPNKPASQHCRISDQVTLHYHRLGAGTPVIFLQGSGPGASGWLNFRYNAQAFADQGFDVLIPDLPGFGDSSKPDLDYTLNFFVDTVLAFTDQLDLQHFALVGNSLGGAVAIGLALAAPERVSQLILMGCGGLEDQLTYFQTMPGIQAMTKHPLGSPEFTPAYLKQVLQLIVADPVHITDELITERFRILATQSPAAFKRMIIPNLTERLPELRCPVLGFWGAQDKFCPPSGALKLTTGCPDARVTLLSDCGHWVMIEQADYFNRTCIDFLKGTCA